MPGKVFNRDRSQIYRWTKEAGLNTPERDISEDIQEIEFDAMRHFVKKEKKLWVIKAFDRGRRRTVGWTLGGCDTRTFKRLYDKVKHLKDAVYYTGDWTSFAKVLPAGRHVIGKSGTVMIECDNGNTRHHLGRFTRKTKVVSKSKLMVDLSLRLWNALTKPDVFKLYQQKFMTIFR